MSSSDKKYIVIAGHVISRHDGNRHFISCDQLMRLYNVPPHECICVSNWKEQSRRRLAGINKEDFIVLRPRGNGHYHIPPKKGETFGARN